MLPILTSGCHTEGQPDVLFGLLEADTHTNFATIAGVCI